MAFINGNLVPFGILFSNVNDTVLGELESAESTKAITITNIGNYYLQSDQFIADLQDMWDWDDDESLLWGCFSFVKNGNNSAGIQDSFTASTNDYGGVIRISERNDEGVYIVKSDKALLIDMSGGSVILFSAKDSNGTERKCVAIGRSESSYNYCVAADDGTSANVYRISNSGNRRLTTSVYELTPFFDELANANGFVKDDNVLIVRSLPAKANGLYKIGNDQYYFGNFIALKDG